MKSSFLLISAALCLTGCGKRAYRAKEYISYVQHDGNGLHKKITIDNWEYSMQYYPYDYIVLRDGKAGREKGRTADRYDRLNGTAWFCIRFKKTNSQVNPLKYGVSSLEEYSQRYAYYTSSAMNDVALVYDKDTLRPMSYVFETSYNTAPFESILVGFDLHENAAPSKKMQLVFFDRIFNNGIIKATYDADALVAVNNIKVAI